MSGPRDAARALLARLGAAGVQLRAHDGRLRWAAPPGVVTEAVQQELAALKPALLDLLTGEAPERALSAAQTRIMVLDQLWPNRPDFTLPVVVRVTGAVDEAAVGRALEAVVARHDVLRSSYAMDAAGRPVARLAAGPFAVPLHVRDVADPEEAVRVAVAEAREPFDLTRAPMLRATLLRVVPQECFLVLLLHHIACDEPSQWIVLHEFAALYREHAGGPPAGLPAARQYADYVAWERDRAAAGVEESTRYWRGQLARLRPAVRRAGPPSVGGGLHTAPIAVGAEQAGALRRLARAEGTTLLVVVLTAFGVALADVVGRADVAVAVPADDRGRVEFEDTVGHFVNTLLLYAAPAGARTLREAVRMVRATVLGALAHADLPYDRVVELLPSGARGTEVYDAWIVLRRPAPVLSVPGLRLAAVDVSHAVTRHGLKLDLVAGPDGLTGTLAAPTDRWATPVVDGLAATVACLLARGDQADADLQELRRATAAAVEDERRRCRADADDGARLRLRSARRRVVG